MISRASSTLRMPRLSETPPSTIWMYGRLTLSPNSASSLAWRVARAAGRAASTAVIVERHGREHHRHRRRCGSGSRKAYRIQIRAEHVEGGLREREAGARRDVRRRRDDQRAFPAIEVAKGRAVEQDLVV